MIDKIIEFMAGLILISFILIYTVPFIVDSINYLIDQIGRINF
jgi:hypothetical protein